MSPLLLLLAFLLAEAYAGCSVDVNGSQMPKPQPLLLKQDGTKDVHGFVIPDSSGRISLNQSNQIIIACPDNTLQVTGQAQATASCVSGSTFSINGRNYNFVDLRCNAQPLASAQRGGSSCGSTSQYQVINLGFQVGPDFYNLIKVCFDNRSLRTVYDHFTMVAQIGGRQISFPRRPFYEGTFFPNIDVKKQYNPDTQEKTVGSLLGSSELGSKYIKQAKDLFLTRGHLTANSDFMLGAQSIVTFWYVNAAPQWQKFNSGNWQVMESNVQSYAQNKQVTLEIYTGTHGITTLPNVRNVQTELYLYADDQGKKLIPVPKIFWRIVHNNYTNAAVVFMGVNNPYINEPGDDYYVCPDVCSQISWIKWNATVKSKGYSRCCKYADFKRAVADVPDLIVHSLLT